VIPYSLYIRSYRLRDALAFIARRLKRLEPPYFACIFLVICLNFLSSLVPGFRGAPPSLNAAQLLAHVAYINSVVGYDWINPVFWSLAIEFQYYFFVALVFPLLNNARFPVRLAALLAIALTGILGSGKPSLLFYWLPLFAIGIATFQVFVGHLSRWSYFVLLLALALICNSVVGLQQTLVGLLTAVTIFTFKARAMPNFLAPIGAAGTISYSLYLMHVPLGGRIINLAARLPPSPLYRYPAIVLAFVVTVGGAYVFWRIVENPSQLWAKRKPHRSEFPQSDMHSGVPLSPNVPPADKESPVAAR
jgi:peptidoglycan/LPS O-acetylase OafA/YrhL